MGCAMGIPSYDGVSRSAHSIYGGNHVVTRL